MSIWPRHIDRFESQYYKAFVGNLLFRANIVDLIHKGVQMFLHSCNTMTLDYTETSVISEFWRTSAVI